MTFNFYELVSLAGLSNWFYVNNLEISMVSIKTG